MVCWMELPAWSHASARMDTLVLVPGAGAGLLILTAKASPGAGVTCAGVQCAPPSVEDQSRRPASRVVPVGGLPMPATLKVNGPAGAVSSGASPKPYRR